jgi:hypothetical protein
MAIPNIYGFTCQKDCISFFSLLKGFGTGFGTFGSIYLRVQTFWQDKLNSSFNAHKIGIQNLFGFTCQNECILFYGRKGPFSGVSKTL